MGGVKVGELYAALRLDRGKFDQEIDGAGRRFGGLRDTAVKVGKVVAAALVGIAVTVGGASLKLAADFDQSMTNSLAIMGDVSDEMREKMEHAARQVAKTTTFSASEAADAYFYLASAGLDATASIAAMPKVAAFAQAGNFDLALATDLLTDAQSALGLSTDDAVENMENMVRVSDVLVRANTLSNATVQQFSEALTNKAGAALRLLNKDVEEGAAVLAAWADQGVKGNEAGEKLNIVLRDLQVSNIKSREEWEALGLSVYDAEGNMRNLADIVGDLEGALEGASDEQVRMTLANLGFQDRSIAAIASLLGQADAIREYEGELRSASGFTEDVAAKQLESFNAQMSLMKSAVADVGISIGQQLLPLLLPMVQAISEWFNENSELITQIAGSVIGVLGQLFGILGDLIGIAWEVGTVISDLAKGAFSFLSSETDALGGVFDWVTTAILPIFSEAMEFITSTVVPALSAVFAGVVGWFRENWPQISRIATIVGDIVATAFRFIVTAIQIAWPVIEKVATFLFPLIGSAASILLDVIEWVFSTVSSVMKAVLPVAEGILRGLVKAFEAISKPIKAVWDGITSAIKDALNFVIRMVNKVIGFLNGLKIDIPSIDLPGIGKVGGGSIGFPHIPSVPELYTGARNFAGGLALVGERGPELVNLPPGSDVYSSGQTAGLLSGNGRVEVVVRDPDGSIRSGGYNQGQIENMLTSALTELVGGARHRSLRVSTD